MDIGFNNLQTSLLHLVVEVNREGWECETWSYGYKELQKFTGPGNSKVKRVSHPSSMIENIKERLCLAQVWLKMLSLEQIVVTRAVRYYDGPSLKYSACWTRAIGY